MRSALTVALVSSALAGCSLIYNPSNLPGADKPGEAGVIDAPPDAPPDAEIILDADPTMLMIESISPSTIDEGQGDGGSRPALVVIGGRQIIDNNTTVEITADSGSALLEVGAPVVSKNGNWIAVAVTAHVDPGLGKGATRALTVKVTQTLPAELGGGTKSGSLSGKLSVVGYNELDSLAKLPMVGGKVNSPMLDALYSKVDLSGMAVPKLGGNDRAIVRSVSQIKLGALDATGADGASNAVAGEAGGCGGGGHGASSPCNTIGGAAGLTNTVGGGGGGGGGFAASGTVGFGMNGGMGGMRTGDELIVTYGGFNGLSENRPGGGGGGGPTLVLLGGGGAASGGSIELTAGGNVSVGTITANGGEGKGGGLAGGGGGGAGGLVMVRAGGTLTTGVISVKGGAGGSGTDAGGAASDGRVRWDAETASPPTVVAGLRTVHRGPAFMLTTQVFRTTDPTTTVVGTAGDRFDVSVENEGMVYPGGSTMIAGNNLGVFSPPLHQGFNHVCILLDGGKPRTSEAEKCVDVAFLP